MSDRRTREQHRRKFQELINPENRSKRFRSDTPSSRGGNNTQQQRRRQRYPQQQRRRQRYPQQQRRRQRYPQQQRQVNHEKCSKTAIKY